MASTLLLPVAGQSSRYAGTRPKWMLTMPDGKLMIEKAVESLNIAGFERVILICLGEHVERYSEVDRLTGLLRESISPKLEILMLDAPTTSQVETIALALERLPADSSFFVKDCDNCFSYSYEGGNEVAVVDLHAVTNVDAANKSYVQTNPMGIVYNIAEKHVIGNLFCCGGYGFGSRAGFLEQWAKLRSNESLYLSHVIFSMIMDGAEFQAREATSYVDWGTLKDYRAYCDKQFVVFCDVDGVLFQNSSRFAAGGWTHKALMENIAVLQEIKRNGHLYLVVTTSRPESMRTQLLQELDKLGLQPDQCVMGLPHGVRYLVNDYSSTNPYPSAVAINLERDVGHLRQLLTRHLPESVATAGLQPVPGSVVMPRLQSVGA